jgi:hypothetical protein
MLTTGNLPAGQTEFAKKLKKCSARRQFNIASGVRLWLHPRVPEQMPAANRCRMRIFYSGRVQGVGFRYTAKPSPPDLKFPAPCVICPTAASN